MGKGEDRARTFSVSVEIRSEDPLLTDEEVAAHEEAIRKEIENNQVWQQVIAALGKGVKIAIKCLGCLALFAALAGCQAPDSVRAAHADTAKAFAHFLAQVDSREAQWRDAFRVEALKRLSQNIEDWYAEKTVEGRISIEDVKAIQKTEAEKRAGVDSELDAQRVAYEKVRAEALAAIRLNTAVERWMDAGGVSASQLQDLVDLAATVAQNRLAQKKPRRRRDGVTLDAPEALRDRTTTTLDVRVRGLWRVRLGVWLIALGCRIAGVGLQVQEV